MTVRDGGGNGGLRRTLFAAAMGVMGVAMFAGTLPATRLAVVELSPAFIAAGRSLLAGLIAGALLWATRQPLPKRSDFRSIVIIALCLVFGFPFFTALAMQHVPAAHGSVVLAILPLATAIAAALVGGERPSLLFWLLSVVGGALVLVFSLSDSGWALIWGDVYLVGAAASAALGYALSGRMARTMPGWAVIAWALLLVLPVSAILTLLTVPSVLPRSPSVWVGFLYLGIVSMFLGFFFWNTAMAVGGIAKVAQLQLLQPFFTMVFAAWVLGETLDARLFAFAFLILVVVSLAQRTAVRRTGLRPDATAPPKPAGP